MEISITWNICRVCLHQDNETEKNSGDGKMMQIFDDGNKLAKHIFECSGILMEANDSLPDKICRKCVSILKYAVHFRKSCRESNGYLQDVIKHTKSASTMFRQERSTESILEPLSDEDVMNFMEENDDLFSLQNSANGSEEKVEKSKPYNQGKLDLKPLRNDKKKMKPIEASTSSSFTREPPPHYTLKEYRKEYEKRKDIIDRIIVQQDEEQEVDEDNCEINIELTKQQSEEAINHDLKNLEEENSNASSVDDINQKSYSKTNKAQKNNLQKPKLICPQEFESGNESEANGPMENEDIYDIDDEASIVESPEIDIIQNLKSDENGGSLYYIINKTNDTGVNQNEEQEDCIISDYNVDFINVAEGEVAHHLKDDTEDGDDTDNQVQVSSTVVTKEEVDLEFINSNSNDNSQVLDGEFVIDAFIDESELNDEMSESNLTIRSTNNSTDANDEHHVSRGRRKKLKSPCVTYAASSSSVQRLLCSICGNNFSSRQMMNAHMKIHRQEKSHECELCLKRFITACNLQAHMRIHTGEKPFECKYCCRRFTDRSTHLRHERIHTNEKPFSCEYCGKSFALGTTLHAHRKVHTGERPFRCEPCGKSFKLPHQLKAHKNTHLHRAVEQSYC